jgi:proline-specific peptidase
MMLSRRFFTGAALTAPFLATRAFAANTWPPAPDPALWRVDVPPQKEGMAEGGPNGAVYYRLHGEAAGRTPIITLHGGPAGGHTYMRPYIGLAEGRQIVLYDQSGCGRSAQPADLALYTVDRYVEEVEAVRRFLGFDKVIVLGHSWGGLLAPAYAAAYPDRVEAVILAGAAAQVSDYADAAHRWLAEMGPKALATVQQAEKTGRTDDPAYQDVLDRYYHAHVVRLKTWPQWVNDAFGNIGSNPVYNALNGPSEFSITGNLATLDLRPKLKHLPMPVLVTCGEFDEAPPWVGKRLVAALPKARLKAFPGLSHCAHIEDPKTVIAAMGGFLKELG